MALTFRPGAIGVFTTELLIIVCQKFSFHQRSLVPFTVLENLSKTANITENEDDCYSNQFLRGLAAGRIYEHLCCMITTFTTCDP